MKKLKIVRKGFPEQYTSVDVTLDGNHIMIDDLISVIADHIRKHPKGWELKIP